MPLLIREHERDPLLSAERRDITSFSLHKSIATQIWYESPVLEVSPPPHLMIGGVLSVESVSQPRLL